MSGRRPASFSKAHTRPETPERIFVPEFGRARDHQALGLPLDLPRDWKEKFLEAFGLMLDRHRSFRVFLDVCVRCGMCADSCPVFSGTGDPRNMPMARAELARKIYRRYFARGSRRLPARLASAEVLSEKTLQEWFIYFHHCLACRRCGWFCPFGIDTAEVTLACREILAAVGLTARCVSEVVAAAEDTGNHLGLPPEVWAEGCTFLEREVFEETGVAVRFPVDVEGCRVLLVPAAEDAFSHYRTMVGYAKMFHVAGVSWTTCSHAADAGNFGLFLGYRHMKKINQKIIEAADRLKVNSIVWGESGHGWRVGRNYTDTMNGPLFDLKHLQDKYPMHICEYTLRLLEAGTFDGKMDKSANDDFIVSYHDPCPAARGADLFESPRRLLHEAVEDFREMPRDTIREWTLCCGGGAGLLGDEALTMRQACGARRAEAFKTTGADFLATTCGTCKSVLPDVLASHLGKNIRVGGVMELFGRALTPYLKAIGGPAAAKKEGFRP